MRKLATIQRILELNPIPNADSIEVVTVLGWKVVVKKGEFEVGDLCVYCEIDSVLPDKPEFQFLAKSKFRIKTVRLRGQVSQGICFPASILMEGETIEEGEEVTEQLGITQHIPQIPADLKGLVKGSFPSGIAKTDETRVQVLGNVLKRYEGTKCYVTEKVDGASVTYFLKDGEFGVCSRNLELLETEGNSFWKLARQMDIEEKLRSYGKNIALQGELIGAGIQKNNLRLPEKKVLFFNAFDIDKFTYYGFADFKKVVVELGLETVPTITEDFALISDVDVLVKMAEGTSIINPKVQREGIVIRPLKEVMDMEMSSGFGNGRLSFKVSNPEYLLMFEEK